MAGLPLSEEQLQYPNAPEVSPGQAAATIGQNTDRTVDQMGRFSEENAQNIRQQYANMASGIDKGMAGYRQGQESSARQRQYQQQFEQGEQQKQRTAQELEEGGYQVEAARHQHDYMNGTEEGQAGPRWQQLQNTAYKHDTEFQPKMDQLGLEQGQAGIRASNASVAASGASTAMNKYSLEQAKVDTATGNAAAEMQAALASGNQAAVDQINGKYAAQGLDSGHLARAKQAATMAISQGQSARDLVWNTGPEGQIANAKLHELENSTENLRQADTWAQQFHAARTGTTEEETAYKSLLTNLEGMGPEGMHAAQAIKEGEGSVGGLSVDTGGFKTTGDRIDAALAQLHQTVTQQHEAFSSQYQGVPSPGFNGRLQRIGQAVQGSGQTIGDRQPGAVNILSGGGGGTGAAAQHGAWLQGNEGKGAAQQPQQSQQNGPAMVPPAQPQPNAQQLYNTNYQPQQPPPVQQPIPQGQSAAANPQGLPTRPGPYGGKPGAKASGHHHPQGPGAGVSPFRGRQ